MAKRATVFLVTGEHCFSQNGEVCWQEGIYRSRASALLAAREAAAEHVDSRCLVDGSVYGPAWGCGCSVLEHGEGCEANPADWDVNIDVREFELEN